MNRQELINRLVTRKLQSASAGRVGCVPCFGAASRAVCFNMAGPTKNSQPTTNRTR